MLGQFQERGLGVVLALVQPHPGDVLDGIVRVLDRRNQAVNGIEIQLGQLVPLVTLGRDAEQPAAVEVAHAVTAHARIVPVGHNQGSIRRHLHIRRSEPAILLGAIQNVHDLRRIPRAAALHRVSPHNAGAGVTMDHLALEHLRQERAFIDADAGGRAGAGEEEIGDHAGIVKVPVTFGDSLLHVGALVAPATAGDFAAKTVVPILHHIIDTHSTVAVIVVVALPQGAKAVDGHHPVVAKVPTERF